MKKKIAILITAIVFIIVIIYICFVDYKDVSKSDGVILNNYEMEAIETTDYVSIPGFNSLTFEANELKQNVNFYNPENNDYAMVMSLVLQDKVIWQSNYILPGYGFYEIELNNCLDIGKYSAQYIIQCFNIETNQEMNGCTINFTLYVE